MDEEILTKKYIEQECRINQLQKEIQLKDRCLSLIAHDFLGVSRNLLWVLEALNDGNISQEIFMSLFPELKKNILTNHKTIESTVAWVNSQHRSFTKQSVLIKPFELFNSINNSLNYNLKEKNISFIYHGNENAILYSDPVLLTFIIKALVENAIKYSFINEAIYFEVQEPNDQELQLIITDSGMGMSEQTLKNLFSLEGSPNMGSFNEKGPGLSLAIVYDLAKLINISITVNSVENKGTKIELKLPIIIKDKV